MVCLMIVVPALGAVPEITCQTNHKSDQFLQFQDSQVVISINRPDATTRQIASSSITFEGLRTKWNGKSVEKIGYFENNKHTIHIDDVSNLSNVNDYISIRSQEGHEMIYPLSCQRTN
ncbi:MAG: hypothetical protein A2X86_07630 [Bdellovibrionales bacterium GWA2_49_15]|nr:MAG: hypothetical protein A2X86_07630 [Bdellovibrionales bacterium GWA2_49_15]HAZ11851.1 hypothetical protein [Bdellovibrionales bacterium]